MLWRSVHQVKRRLQLALGVSALVLANAVAAASLDLSSERMGVGLKAPRAQSGLPFAIGSEPLRAWTPWATENSLHTRMAEWPRLGLRPAGPGAAVYYALTDTWGSSIEAAYAPESWAAPRRYTLSGQVYTAFSEGRGLSFGVRYRVYETGPDFGAPSGGYALWSWRQPGVSVGPSYQLQLSYQYSAAGAFGLALGRDLETFTPYFDLPANGLRQLTFTGQHWLTPSWALSYDVLSNDPGSAFRFQGLRLGVRYRF